jgi:hypothetical protein
MAQTSDRFDNQWNYSHCSGVLDGKHIVIQVHGNSGSYYCKYKSTFIIVVLAVIDAEYKFLYIDAGCNGRVSWWGHQQLHLVLSIRNWNY